MTKAYDWNPMPHTVNVVCPACSAKAVFEFAEAVKIKLKTDIDYFKKSKFFDYTVFTDPSGQKWPGAIFYHGLHSTNTIKDLPEGYSLEDFQHRPYWYRSHGSDIGTTVCNACGTRKKSHLRWPQDAFFQCEVKGHVLWAFDRESLIALRDFIESDNRDIKNQTYHSFLHHIPSVFLDRKNRKTVVTKLNRLLQ